jgi:hypothetical protein
MVLSTIVGFGAGRFSWTGTAAPVLRSGGRVCVPCPEPVGEAAEQYGVGQPAQGHTGGEDQRVEPVEGELRGDRKARKLVGAVAIIGQIPAKPGSGDTYTAQRKKTSEAATMARYPRAGQLSTAGASRVRSVGAGAGGRCRAVRFCAVGRRGSLRQGAEHGGVHEGAEQEPYRPEPNASACSRPLGAGAEGEDHAQQGEGAVSINGPAATGLSGTTNIATTETPTTVR